MITDVTVKQASVICSFFDKSPASQALVLNIAEHKLTLPLFLRFKLEMKMYLESIEFSTNLKAN